MLGLSYEAVLRILERGLAATANMLEAGFGGTRYRRSTENHALTAAYREVTELFNLDCGAAEASVLTVKQQPSGAPAELWALESLSSSPWAQAIDCTFAAQQLRTGPGEATAANPER